MSNADATSLNDKWNNINKVMEQHQQAEMREVYSYVGVGGDGDGEAAAAEGNGSDGGLDRGWF